MAKGKQRKKLPYIVRDPYRLQRRFYDGFDHKFLYRKAQTLMLVVQEQVRLKELVKQVEQEAEESTDIPLSTQDLDAKYFECLRAEVYFTEMHQFESFFALLLAVFQDLPHWLYLTTYETGELKTAIQQYVAGEIADATNGKAVTVEDFIIQAVYAGFRPLDTDSSEWRSSVEVIDWSIKRIGQRYLEAVEYNGYKHGLRVLTGHTTLSVRVADPAGYPFGPTYVIGDSEDSLSFLDREDRGEGGETIIENTKHFNPQESFEHIKIMQLILDELMRIRIARVRQEQPEYLTTLLVDRAKLHALRKRFMLTLTA